MKVLLTIGTTTFLTTATKAAEVAELLGDMKQVSSKYWDNGLEIGQDGFENGNVQFIAGDASLPSKYHMVEINQRGATAVFASEAAADDFISTMKQ